MKVLYSWLKEWVDFDLSPEDLAAALTLAGAEVESLVPAAPSLDRVVAGRVLSCADDPARQGWKWCGISVGEEQLELLCGAPNIRPETLVAVALPGAPPPRGIKSRTEKIRREVLRRHGLLGEGTGSG